MLEELTRTFAALALASVAVACAAAEPPAGGTAGEDGAGPAQGASGQALEELEATTLAVRAWREELAAGGQVDDGGLLALRGATRELGRELDALLDQVAARDAAVAPDGASVNTRTYHELMALQRAQPWIDARRATGEGADERRASALTEVRAALGSDDRLQQLAALRSLSEPGDEPLDAAAFRTGLVALAEQERGLWLVAALDALAATGLEPGDEELVQAAWERDPEGLGQRTIDLLVTFGDGRLEGRSEQIALACLAGVDGRRANLQLSGLWGARVGPLLEARLLELARDPDPAVRRAALHLGLSTLEDKSRAVVDALLSDLEDPDRRSRALWGLQRGVPPALQPRVIEAAGELGQESSDPELQAACRDLLRRYGGED